MWYVIQTMSGEEEKCLEQCRKKLGERDGQTFFIPRYVTKVHYQKAWHDKMKILFPGYFFIDTEEIDAVMEGLCRIPQFARVLRSGDVVAPVTKEEQEFLQSLMDEEYIVRQSEGFLIGDEVCITSGTLRDKKGYIRRVDRHRRIAYLEVDLFGRRTPVEIGFSAVARLTRDEFCELKEKMRQETSIGEIPSEKRVKIISGMFEGMIGEFLSADVDRDEWTVLLKLFGSEPSRVVFQKEEIQRIGKER